MITKRKLLKRIEALEKEVKLSVPVVDKNGEQITKRRYFWGSGTSYELPEYKKIDFKEVCKALQDMCDIEITYQENKNSVVIYEKDDDSV